MSVSSWQSRDNDEDTTDGIIAATRRGLYSPRDDVDNSSRRSTNATSSVTSQRSNYVWDTLDADNAPPSYRHSSHSFVTMSPSSMSRPTDDEVDCVANNLADFSVSTLHTNTIDNSDIATYFSLPTHTSKRGGAHPNPSPDGGLDSASKSIRSINTNNSNDISSLQTVVDEVKGKVDTMKAELSSKTKKTQELKADLARTQAAKERRVEKFKNIWQARIRDVNEEHTVVLLKQSEFLRRLETDVKKMQEKRTLLQEKQIKASAGTQQSVELYSDECRRRGVRARRQWEHDEKILFEKSALAKGEAMKKAAADALGPKIDRMVLKGKEEARRLADDLELKLQELRHRLQGDMDTQLRAAAATLAEEVRADDERTRRSGERRLEEAMRRHGDEVSALRERFSRDRKMLEESLERGRRLDAEASLEAIRSVRKGEAKAMEEALRSQQEELAAMARAHAEEAVSLQRSLREEEEQWGQKCMAHHLQARVDRGQRVREQALRRVAAETERVLDRVREEVQEERQRLRAAVEADIEGLRASVQTRLDGLQQTENRSRERSASLRIDIDGLRHQQSILQESHEPRAESLSHFKARHTELRLQLRQVEQELDLSRERREEEGERRRRQHRAELDQWAKMEEDTREAVSRQEVQVANRQEDLRSEHRDELMRIRDKVATLLGRKDGSLRELRNQLAELQGRNAQMQEAIDQRRDSKFGVGK